MVRLTKVFRPVTGVCTALGVLVVATSAVAEPSTEPINLPVVDPNAGFTSPESSGGLFNDASGPMDLIHRAVLMNDMSLSDFQQQQGNRLTREAEAFRQLQMEALRQQPAASGVAEPTEEPELVED